jgi:DMSO/TMAO reductase YedYZ molybdopterin-dependent catalytic subunit
MENNKLSRREFMALSGGTLVQIGLPGAFVKLSHAKNAELASELRPDGRLRIPPGQEAVESIQNMGGMSGPGLDPEWRLQIKGEVKKLTTFAWNDLMQFPQTDLLCDVHCVTGWTLLDSRWQGILLRHIMDAVEVKEQAAFVIFEAHAGYTTSIPISEARKDNVILAHTFSGKHLHKSHGAPLRGLVPDLYFYKSAKWIKGIKFSAKDELGYWESGGFSNTADPWEEDRYK